MLRLRRRARRAGLRAMCAAAALVFLFGVLVLVHVAAFAWIMPSMGPIGAALVLAGVDLIVAGLLAFLATRRGVDRVEMEALAVRQAATRELASSAIMNILAGLLRRR